MYAVKLYIHLECILRVRGVGGGRRGGEEGKGGEREGGEGEREGKGGERDLFNC